MQDNNNNNTRGLNRSALVTLGWPLDVLGQGTRFLREWEGWVVLRWGGRSHSREVSARPDPTLLSCTFLGPEAAPGAKQSGRFRPAGFNR